MQLEIPAFLEATVAEMVAFVPNLVGALLVLLIGWAVGRGVKAVVTRVVDRVNVDRAMLKTPLGTVLGGTEKAVSNTFGTIAAYFVYALALLAAADVLDVPILSEWLATAVSYLPAFVAGLLVIVLGFVVADFVGDAIERTRAATETAYTSAFATGVRVFLYFTVLVIGLDTMGVDVTLLNTMVQALAWGLAAAVAIGVGVALGWGGKDYVHDNIEGWMGRASAAGPRSRDDTEPAAPLDD